MNAFPFCGFKFICLIVRFYLITDHIAGSLPHSLAVNPLAAGECQSSLGSFNPNTAICCRAQGNACDVDNGSALACTRGNGRYLLKGIYSGESGCGPSGLMSFTKMDVDFIKSRGSASKSLPIGPSSRSGAYTAPAQQQQQQPQQQYQPQQHQQNQPQQSRGLKKYLPPNYQQ